MTRYQVKIKIVDAFELRLVADAHAMHRCYAQPSTRSTASMPLVVSLGLHLDLRVCFCFVVRVHRSCNEFVGMTLSV